MWIEPRVGSTYPVRHLNTEVFQEILEVMERSEWKVLVSLTDLSLNESREMLEMILLDMTQSLHTSLSNLYLGTKNKK